MNQTKVMCSTFKRLTIEFCCTITVPLYKAVPIPDSGSPQQHWQTFAPVCFCILHSKDKD